MCSSPNPGSAEASPPPPPLPTISGLVVSRDAGAEDVDGGTQTTPAGHSRQPPESSMLVCGTVAEKASTHAATVLSLSGRSTLDHVGSSRSTPTVTNAVTALVTPASHSASAEHVRLERLLCVYTNDVTIVFFCFFHPRHVAPPSSLVQPKKLNTLIT